MDHIWTTFLDEEPTYGLTVPNLDRTIVGMGDVVKKEKGGKFIGWYVRYVDLDGRRKQRASHQPTKALARRFLLEIEARIARGTVGIIEPEPEQPELTVAAMCESFLASYNRPRIKDLARYKSETQTALRRLLPVLGEQPASAVKQADVRRERDRLMTTFAKNTVTHTLRALSTVYNWARREGLITCDNPCVGVERAPMEHLLEYLGAQDRGEIARFLKTARARAEQGGYDERLLYAMAATALFTGLRKGELFGLRWQDIDLQHRRLDVAKSYEAAPKSNKVRHLRVNRELVPILAEWKRHCPATPAGLVFPVRAGKDPARQLKERQAVASGNGARARAARKRLRDLVPTAVRYRMGQHEDMLGLEALIEAAGCSPMQRPWHALRHTFASHYMMSGGNILTLQKVLGHSDIKMTMIYAHLAPDYLGEEMDRLRFGVDR